MQGLRFTCFSAMRGLHVQRWDKFGFRTGAAEITAVPCAMVVAVLGKGASAGGWNFEKHQSPLLQNGGPLHGKPDFW